MRHFKIKSSSSGLKQVGGEGSEKERERMLAFEGLAGNDQTALSFAHNEELAKRGARLIRARGTITDVKCLGEQITSDFLRRAVDFWYPKLPKEGIEYGWQLSMRSPG